MPSLDQGMGPLSTKLSPSKGSSTRCEGGIEEGVYYAVYIPADLLGGYENEFSECERVFDNKEEALLFIKKNKKIRFKSFRNFQDAQNFAYNGCAAVNSSLLDSSGVPNVLPESLPSAGGQTPSTTIAAEKPSPFKSLKSQELVKLRKLIEKGNLGDVKKLVWENPRYLVSSGDFPTILHEGCRYNALHVSTKAMNPAMTELLLETIGNPAFTNLLYDTSSQENHSYIERSEILLDLYLNTPDKALNETPLHFASKFGSVECVKRLIACSKTHTQARNKEKKTPLDVVCSRCSNATEEVKSSIRRLLSEEQYYVPIWSSSDACDVPLVGPPCKTNQTPSKMSKRRDELDITSPTLEIKAFAGPMNESSAKAFRSKWKREVKSVDLLSSPLSTPRQTNSSSLNNSSFIQSPPTSVEKSFEIVGRRLALENKYEWRENWPFLNKCIDLQSSSGLDMLEAYLHNKLVETLSAQKVASNSDSVRADSKSGGTRDNNSDCLISPIEKLCINFDTLSLSAHSNKSEISANSSSSSVTNMSHLLIEKSCEVFSKRLLQGLKNAAFEHNRCSLVRILRQESKHLNNVVSSFTGDPRFQGVSLNRIHSTIARCLISLLINSCPPECVHWIVATFSDIASNKLLTRYSLNSESTSSDKSLEDDEDNASVLCLISQILGLFDPNKSDGTLSEGNEDSNPCHSSAEDVIHGRGTGLKRLPHSEDLSSYLNNNHWASDNSSSNKVGASLNENSNKLGRSLQENGSLSQNGDQSNVLPTVSSDGNPLQKVLVDLSNSEPSQAMRERTDESLSKPIELVMKPSSSFTNGILKSFAKEDCLYVSSGSEKEAERKWNLSVPCSCTSRPVAPRNLFSNIRSYSRFHSYRTQYETGKAGKRIDFDVEDVPMRVRSTRGTGVNVSGSSQGSDRSIAETNYNLSAVSSSSSDSSDTDDEYYTPPGSYTTDQVFMSSSEEEMMDATEEDTEVFLIGDCLSATDVDVFQTLAQCCSIDSVHYPNIYKWRHLVQLKLNLLSQETFNLNHTASPVTTGSRNLNRLLTSPRVLPSPRSLFSPVGGARQLFPGGTNASLSRQSAYKPLQASTPSDLTKQS